MNIKYTDFGQILIDNQIYGHDMVLNNGTPEKRQKKRSRSLKGQYGHTPLGRRENIPWNCSELVIGTGYLSFKKSSWSQCGSPCYLLIALKCQLANNRYEIYHGRKKNYS